MDMSEITISCEKGCQFVWKDNVFMCRRIKRFLLFRGTTKYCRKHS